MQLTIFTDSALRVRVYAAGRPDARALTSEVAITFGISGHHVVKVVNQLQHLGYIETSRGRDGGFTLARPSHQIRVGELIRKVEGTLALVEGMAPSSNTCLLTRACGLQGVLNEAIDAFFAVLDHYTLADLLAERRWVARLTSMSPPPRRAWMRQLSKKGGVS